MRILHVIGGIQETCGVSQFVVNVARAQQAAGHQVAIVTRMTCGFPVDDLEVQHREDPTQVEFAPDVVHIHSLWDPYLHRMAVWSRRRHLPYVVSPHGSLKGWALRYRLWKKLPALVLYQYRDLRMAAAFHITAESERAGLRRLGLRQPITVAPLGCEPVLPMLDEAMPRTDVVFVGRIHPVKNLFSVIRAWAGLQRRTRLIIAGSDDIGHQSELKALAVALGLKVFDMSRDLGFGKKQAFGGGEVPLSTFQRRLADCDAEVVFTGPVYAAAKDWMFAHARVAILASHTENFGGVVVEALAQGTPVIASTGTPWAALREHGCGWWTAKTPAALGAALADALTRGEPELLTMRRRARALVAECLSWSRVSEALTAGYPHPRRPRAVIPDGTTR